MAEGRSRRASHDCCAVTVGHENEDVFVGVDASLG